MRTSLHADTDAARTLRRFNRDWSRRVGVLEESFLGTGRSLVGSRLLFEVGQDDRGVSVRELRRRLGLDSGYLSRLLRRLEAEGLVTVRPDPADRRRRMVVPTEAGRRARTDLDHRSDELAEALVSGLTPGQQRRLAEALDTAGRLLRTATITFRALGPDSPDAVGAVRRYFAEIDARFPDGFDPGDAATADVAGMTPPHGGFLAAFADGAVVACGGIQPVRDEIAEIKRMWVDPDWRGCGLGSRMLASLEDEARRLGYANAYLDTHATLTEAISMYERSGYRPIERYNDNPYAQRWFAKPLR